MTSDVGPITERDTTDSTTMRRDVVEAEISRDEWETMRSERARNGVWQRVLPLIDAIDSPRRHDDTTTPLRTVALDVSAGDDVTNHAIPVAARAGSGEGADNEEG